MPITINTVPRSEYDLKSYDLRDGEAYEDENGNIYIGNRFESVSAFGIGGDAVVLTADLNMSFRVISLEINAKPY